MKKKTRKRKVTKYIMPTSETTITYGTGYNQGDIIWYESKKPTFKGLLARIKALFKAA